MTTMGKLLMNIGPVKHYSMLDKEERFTLNLLIKDGLAKKIHRGRGKTILVEPTLKGKQLQSLIANN